MPEPSLPSAGSGWIAPGQQRSFLLCCANNLINQAMEPVWFVNTHIEKSLLGVLLLLFHLSWFWVVTHDMGIAQREMWSRWRDGGERRGCCCWRWQLLFLQRLPAGGDGPFCGSSFAQKFVGKPPRLASPALGGGEKDPIETRCCVGRGQGWRPAALAQPTIAQGDGTCKVMLVALCLQEGGHIAPAQRNEIWEEREWQRRQVQAWTAAEPAWVCNWTCVSGRAYLEMEMNLSQDQIQKYTDCLQLYVNSTVKELRRLFLVQDLVDSLKVGLL